MTEDSRRYEPGRRRARAASACRLIAVGFVGLGAMGAPHGRAADRRRARAGRLRHARRGDGAARRARGAGVRVARRGRRRGRHRARQPADARRRPRGRRRAARRRTRMRAYVDLSTTGPAMAAAEVAATLRAAGVACLDAPVSGGVAGAQAGTLTIMAAGDEALFESPAPAARGARRATSCSSGAEPGQGQLAKVLNNLLSASAIAITGEALALGVHGGLVRAHAARRLQLEQRAQHGERGQVPQARAAADLRRRLPARADAQGRPAVPGRGASARRCRWRSAAPSGSCGRGRRRARPTAPTAPRSCACSRQDAGVVVGDE